MGSAKYQMIPAHLFEQKPGPLRVGLLACTAIAMIAPLVLLMSSASDLGDSPGSWASAFDSIFGVALLRTLAVSFMVGLGSFLIGRMLGVYLALFQSPMRRMVFTVAVFPVAVPPFVYAIGWSDVVDLPMVGTVIAHLHFGIAAVTLLVMASFTTVGRTQIEGVLINATRLRLFQVGLKEGRNVALAGAVFVAALTAGDPGPAQIMSLHSGAVVVLTTFTAFFDFGIASLQCLVLSLAVIVIVSPWLIVLGSGLVTALVGDRAAVFQPVALPGKTGLIVALVTVCWSCLPLVMLVQPVLDQWPFAMAWQYLRATFWETLSLALWGAGLVTVGGFALAIIAGKRVNVIMILSASLWLCLPAMLPAMGVMVVQNYLPAFVASWLDDGLGVWVAYSLRFIPVGLIFGYVALSRVPQSSSYAAAVAGVGFMGYLAKVLIPRWMPTIIAAITFVALMITVELNILLLLRPPGVDTFPVAIYTVMSNAPEALVGLLSLIYYLATLAFAWASARVLM